MPHKAREKFKTENDVFDEFTSQTLFKLCSEGHFERLKSPLSIGKESNVFAAETKSGNYVAVKIYRLETSDFNRMFYYIKSDPRFTGLLHQRRKIIFAWAQREYRNLMLAREAGVSAPMPITFKNNVLIEEFVGTDSPAPRLITSPPKDIKKFFSEVIKNISLLYSKKMTHGDLSAFNILNFNEKPVFIDFSHSTLGSSPIFEELFLRDVTVVVNDFIKLGLKVDIAQVINTIKGMSPKHESKKTKKQLK